MWASEHGRAFVTFNTAHFAAMHTEWLRRGSHHAGVVVSFQRPLGDTLRRLLRLAKSLDDVSMRDRLEFLSDW